MDRGDRILASEGATLSVGSAVITGASGQDGRLMAALLSARGYHVVGITGRAVAEDRPAGFDELIAIDYDDAGALAGLVAERRPDLLFNYAALSTGADFYASFPLVMRRNGDFVIALLEAIRTASPATRFFQASSSEMFGRVTVTPQDETTPCQPISPYGLAKFTAHRAVAIYRETYGLFACGGILYNHDSPLRRPDYVLAKIAKAVAEIKAGVREGIELGRLDVYRDWGDAREYAEAIFRIVSADTPSDYVIATGRISCLADVCADAFAYVGLDAADYIKTDPSLIRPIETAQLCGDPSKIERELGWRAVNGPREVMRAMIDANLARLG